MPYQCKREPFNDDLVQIIGNPTANREWHRSLAAVAGVYLTEDDLAEDTFCARCKQRL